LIGNITQIRLVPTVIAVILSALVFVVVYKIFSAMMLINVSEDLAQVEGYKLKKYNLIYLFCIAIIVALGVRLVGGLLTAALVAVPAATARNLSKSAKVYAIWSIILGMLAPVLGLFVFKLTALPAGSLIILSSVVFFIISIFLAKKH